MNVTPLIDILLVLLIVFMVIVATSKEYVVNTQLPEEGEEPHQNERTIVIQIIWSPQQQALLLKINQESVPRGQPGAGIGTHFPQPCGKDRLRQRRQ
jgi:biopolymer transport protein ExbD